MANTRLGLVLALGALIAFPAGADAEEGDRSVEQRLKDVQSSIKKHLKDKDSEGLVADAEVLVTLYSEAEPLPKVQTKVLETLGGLTKVRFDEQIVMGVFTDLAGLEDPRGAKYIRPFLKQKKPTQAPKVLRAAVEAAGLLPHDSLVGPLLKIVDKSKTWPVAASAMEALGSYGRSKKRVKILEALVKTTLKSRSGGKGRMGGGSGGGMGDEFVPDGYIPQSEGGPSGRWASLAGELGPTLNKLTGQKVTSLSDWFLLVKQRKGKLGSLFLDDDE